MGMKCVYLFIISSLDYHELVSTCEENVPGYCVTTSDGGINSGNNRRISCGGDACTPGCLGRRSSGGW